MLYTLLCTFPQTLLVVHRQTLWQYGANHQWTCVTLDSACSGVRLLSVCQLLTPVPLAASPMNESILVSITHTSMRGWWGLHQK